MSAIIYLSVLNMTHLSLQIIYVYIRYMINFIGCVVPYRCFTDDPKLFSSISGRFPVKRAYDKKLLYPYSYCSSREELIKRNAGHGPRHI